MGRNERSIREFGIPVVLLDRMAFVLTRLRAQTRRLARKTLGANRWGIQPYAVSD